MVCQLLPPAVARGQRCFSFASAVLAAVHALLFVLVGLWVCEELSSVTRAVCFWSVCIGVYA